MLASVPPTLDDEEASTSPFPLPLHVMVGQQKVGTSRLLNPQPVCASRWCGGALTVPLRGLLYGGLTLLFEVDVNEQIGVAMRKVALGTPGPHP